MYRKELVRSLQTATALFAKWIKGEISFEEFVDEYGSFYHYQALDGHEASTEQKKVLEELREFVELHEKIQNTVVDAVYVADVVDEKQLERTGRITIVEAERRLTELSSEYHVEEMLKALSG